LIPAIVNQNKMPTVKLTSDAIGWELRVDGNNQFYARKLVNSSNWYIYNESELIAHVDLPDCTIVYGPMRFGFSEATAVMTLFVQILLTELKKSTVEPDISA
jgi:hypothetical protein